MLWNVIDLIGYCLGSNFELFKSLKDIPNLYGDEAFITDASGLHDSNASHGQSLGAAGVAEDGAAVAAVVSSVGEGEGQLAFETLFEFGVGQPPCSI